MTDAQLWQGGRKRRGGRRRGEALMVPDAEFSSYYGRPVLKRPVWEERDIAGYLFAGGLAAGSSLIAAGADLTGRDQLCQVMRLSAVGGVGVSLVALVHDLGRPERFLNMLRVLKPTSPMSVGTWMLSAFSVPAGVAAAAEIPAVIPRPLRPLVAKVATPAGVSAAAIAPAVATYTAVLIADTAVPTWHAAYPELPFVFSGSALAAASGLAMMLVPNEQCGPVRRLAVAGAALELAAAQRMESRLGLLAEPLRQGEPGRKLRAARAATAAGAAVGLAAGGRWRAAAIAAGAALVAGSVLTRFGIFEAGVESTEDPKYVVQPQRERLVRTSGGQSRGQSSPSV